MHMYALSLMRSKGPKKAPFGLLPVCQDNVYLREAKLDFEV